MHAHSMYPQRSSPYFLPQATQLDRKEEDNERVHVIVGTKPRSAEVVGVMCKIRTMQKKGTSLFEHHSDVRESCTAETGKYFTF